MKYYDLDLEEKQILGDFDNDEFKSVKNLKAEKNRYQKIAGNTLSKNKNINIRLSQKILIKLKAKAASLGIPYQTLAASILYQSVSLNKGQNYKELIN